MKRHLLICGERGVGKSTLIRRLLEQEREKSIKKAPGHEAGGVSDKDLLIEAIQKIGDSDTALAVLDALNKRMQELR